MYVAYCSSRASCVVSACCNDFARVRQIVQELLHVELAAELAAHRHDHAHEVVHQVAGAWIGSGHRSPAVMASALQPFLIGEAAFFFKCTPRTRQELASTTSKKARPLDT